MLEFNKWTRRYRATNDSVYVIRRRRRLSVAPVLGAWLMASVGWSLSGNALPGAACAVVMFGLLALAVMWMFQPPMVVGLDEECLVLDGERARWDDVIELESRDTLLGRRLLARVPTGKSPRVYQSRLTTPEADIVREMQARAGCVLRVVPAAPTKLAPMRRLALVAAGAVVVAVYCVLPIPGATLERPGDPVTVASRLRGAHARPGALFILGVHPGPAGLAELAAAWPGSGDTDVFWHWPWEVGAVLRGGGTDGQRVLAERSALVAASACLGRPVSVDGGAQRVARLHRELASPGPVAVGDRVVALDDNPVRYIEDLFALASARRPGDDVVLEAQSPAGVVHVARLPVRDLHDGAQFFAGIEVESEPLLLGPTTIAGAVDLSAFGGPSAGLASALGLVDAAGPVPVAAGRRIAVTGTVAPDGLVGPIGGLKYKAALARRARAEILVVPSTQVGFAERFAGPMEVVGARTLDDALRVLGGPGCEGESR